MYCLRWWIPIFLLPFPTAPPIVLVFFLTAYTFQTRPCIYCAAILIGLFFSTCYWHKAADALQGPRSDLSLSDKASSLASHISLSVSSALEPVVPGTSSAFMKNIWGKAKVASSSVSSAASLASKSASHASESSEASKVSSIALDRISEQLLLSPTSVASAVVTKAPATSVHSAAPSAKAEGTENEFCNCWLSFGPSGRGFKGLFKAVPRRPASPLVPGTSLVSKALSGWDTVWTHTAGIPDEGSEQERKIFWSKWRIPKRIWFGLPDSTFGVWLDLGW